LPPVLSSKIQLSVLLPSNFTAGEAHLTAIMGGPQNWSGHGGGKE